MSTDTHPTTRTLVSTEQGFVIQTANSVSTVTAQCLKLPLKAYDTYDSRGVNTQLLTDVMGAVRTNQLLWNQNVWRAAHVFTPPDANQDPAMDYYWQERAEKKSEVDALVAFPTDPTKPTCGTQMCAAGWTGELTGVDWVIDARILSAMLKAGAPSSSLDEHLPQVFVTQAWIDEHIDELHVGDEWDQYWEDDMPTYAMEIIKDRGFSHDTHAVIAVSDYAKVRLGIGSDPLLLFNGELGLEEMERRAQIYIDYGSDFSYAQASELMYASKTPQQILGITQDGEGEH